MCLGCLPAETVLGFPGSTNILQTAPGWIGAAPRGTGPSRGTSTRCWDCSGRSSRCRPAPPGAAAVPAPCPGLSPAPRPARPVPAHLGAELVEVVHVGAHGLRQRLAGEVEQPHGGGGAGAGPGGWSRRRLSLSIGGRTFRTRTAEGTRGSRPDQAAPPGGSLAPAARAGPGVSGAGV